HVNLAAPDERAVNAAAALDGRWGTRDSNRGSALGWCLADPFGRAGATEVQMTTDDGRRMTAGNFYRSGVVAKVKWFDPAKGFGFVTPDDGSPDAFLHASLLKPLGRESVPEGAVLSCDINKGTKGPQVALIHSLEEPPPPARAGNRGPGGRRTGRVGGASGQSAKPTAPRGSLAVAVPPVAATGRQAPGHSKPVEGTVKFFDPRKGFGFL